ncbi:MAG: hypothetical protein IH987_13710 [Planctomycetes bacterium]|nr:hypothetical protein [Planctomycetota bacterium]
MLSRRRHGGASLGHGTHGQARKILGAMAKPGIPGRRHASSQIPHGGASLGDGTWWHEQLAANALPAMPPGARDGWAQLTLHR